jgi:hypothetical protein
MPDAVYTAITDQNEAFGMPNKPATPNCQGAASVGRYEITDTYNSAIDMYQETRTWLNHFKEVISKAVPDIYILNILADDNLEYAHVTPKQQAKRRFTGDPAHPAIVPMVTLQDSNLVSTASPRIHMWADRPPA